MPITEFISVWGKVNKTNTNGTFVDTVFNRNELKSYSYPIKIVSRSNAIVVLMKDRTLRIIKTIDSFLNIPINDPNNNNIIDVVTGNNNDDIVLAIRANKPGDKLGSIVGWGEKSSSRILVPSTNPDGTIKYVVPSNISQLNNVMAVSVSVSSFALALIDDGTGNGTGKIIAWGTDDININNKIVSLTNSGKAAVTIGSVTYNFNFTSGIVAIATGDTHALALKKDGSIMIWGKNSGYFTAPYYISEGVISSTPSKILTSYDNVQIAAGNGFSIVLKKSGIAIAWSTGAWYEQQPGVEFLAKYDNNGNLTNVLYKNITSVVANGWNTMICLNNKTIIVNGGDPNGYKIIPSEVTNSDKIVSMSINPSNAMAIYTKFPTTQSATLTTSALLTSK